MKNPNVDGKTRSSAGLDHLAFTYAERIAVGAADHADPWGLAQETAGGYTTMRCLVIIAAVE